MNRTTSISIAALLVASVAAGIAVPAFAQDQGGPRQGGPQQMQGPDGEHGPGDHRRGGRDGMRGGLFALVCGEQSADRLEHMLLSIAQRTDPTAEQQPLYDALKTAAITAQADFAAVCEANKPADGVAPTADLVDRMSARLEIEEARVVAMGEVLPAFEAFYDSLTDAQKAAMQPPRGERRDVGERREGKPGEHRRGPAGETPELEG